MNKLTPDKFADHLIRICQQKKPSIAFPEGLDTRVLTAAQQLLEHDCVSKIALLGDPETISAEEKDQVPHLNWTDDRLLWVPKDLKNIEELAAETFRSYLTGRGKEIKTDAVVKWAQHPANQAATLVNHNIVDAALGGCIFTTADVIRATLQGVGLTPGNKTISGSFAMTRERGDDLQAFMFADCGVVIDPTAEQLVDIAEATCNTFCQLFPDQAPKVAFLSFSTKGSARHPSADKMIQAYESFRERNPNILADGELQFDAAFVPGVAARKCPDSQVAGQANCFIFPNLDAGNIAYKITQRLGEFHAYGPILQGSAKPYSDLSRGASAHDIFMAALITMLRA